MWLNNQSSKTIFCLLDHFSVIKWAGTMCSCWFTLWTYEWVCVCKRGKKQQWVSIWARTVLEGQPHTPSLKNSQERELGRNLHANIIHSFRWKPQPSLMCMPQITVSKYLRQNTYRTKGRERRIHIDSWRLQCFSFSN